MLDAVWVSPPCRETGEIAAIVRHDSHPDLYSPALLSFPLRIALSFMNVGPGCVTGGIASHQINERRPWAGNTGLRAFLP